MNLDDEKREGFITSIVKDLTVCVCYGLTIQILMLWVMTFHSKKPDVPP